MNVKDLMIGDWVCYDGDTEYTLPIRVTGLDLGDVATDEDGWIGGNKGVLIPIPLTEEILVKNGFTFTFDYFWSFCKNDFERIMLRFCKENEEYMNENTFSYFKNHWIFDENYRIDYVHELQHVLRLCGLTELSEKFKVEGCKQ